MRHPNILPCLGMYADSAGRKYMITEYMNKGSLLDFLRHNDDLDIHVQMDLYISLKFR